MTEDEAKTKPCIGPCPTVTGRLVRGGKEDGSDAYLCNGSACLGWRSLGRYLEPGEGLQPGESYPLGGYCGLAGKP